MEGLPNAFRSTTSFILQVQLVQDAAMIMES